MNACVLVFGDLGHSPRMQNHALSLSECEEIDTVFFVGYEGSDLPLSIKNNDKIQVRYISTRLIDKLKRLPRIFYLVYVLLRIVIQILQTLWMLFRLPGIRYWFYQNPPCIPGLFCLIIVRLFRRRSRIVLDWHNYGFSILRVSGVNRFLVKIARIYERFCGRMCDFHLCVSKNFEQDLIQNFGIPQSTNDRVLYDRATSKFKRLSLEERYDLFCKLWGEDNKFIHKADNKIQEIENRDLILFSSTSYTPDEDFNVVVNALKQLDEKLCEERKETNKGPGIHLIVTGKGPLKQSYQQIFEECNESLKYIRIETMWLEVEDYPKLVGSADLGVCLHFSSSGLDLPMKVVDMFAAKLGCLAINYQSISELVKDNKNGQIFVDEKQLSDQIYAILSEFKNGNSTILNKFRENLESEFNTLTWNEHWKDVVYENIISN